MPKFRVLAGSHCERGLLFKAGDVVDSESDLTEFNHGPGFLKFELVDPRTTASEGLVVGPRTGKDKEKTKEADHHAAEVARKQPDIAFTPETRKEQEAKHQQQQHQQGKK